MFSSTSRPLGATMAQLTRFRGSTAAPGDLRRPLVPPWTRPVWTVQLSDRPTSLRSTSSTSVAVRHLWKSSRHSASLPTLMCSTSAAEWAGLSERTRFQVGDATATGLPDAAVDAALTVHVAMNISDKHALYAEAFRVLRPGGRFVVYDVLQGEGGDVQYPVPWANDCSTSFLATPEDMRELLPAAGFEVISEVDSSDESLVWFQQMRARIQRDGPPPVTFAAFLGDAFGQMAANQVSNLAERRIRTVMFACSRPF